MKKKRIIISVAATTLFLALGLSPVAAQETVRIGYLTPLTGPGSLLGLTGREGFTLGLEDVNARGGINGKKLEAIIYDSQSKPTVAATLAQRLMLEDKVPLIVVASGSVDVLAIAEVTERAKMPVFCMRFLLSRHHGEGV
jgi:branched-chain amino acid transport system substrate-binding protein